MNLIPISKIRKVIPNSPGVYIFWETKNKPHYVGKAINLKNRINSYFSKAVEGKTRKMVRTSSYLSFIVTSSELEALLLEAKLVKKYKTKYNVLLKDDKAPLYIKITKEKYPRVIAARKNDTKDAKELFGPYPSSNNVKKVLRIIRNTFHLTSHKPSSRTCLYAQMGLCDPCPSYIEMEPDPKEKATLRKKYLKNVRLAKSLLNSDINKIKKALANDIQKYSENQLYEDAREAKEKLECLNYITQPIFLADQFIKNPNFVSDIYDKQTKELQGLLSDTLKTKKLKRIECYDISHLSGIATAASMVVAENGQMDSSKYRHFRIRKKTNADDIKSLDEVIKRRLKHLSDWGVPDLVIVDGGKTQTKKFYESLSKYQILVVGIAKRYETLIIPSESKGKVEFTSILLKKGPAKNLVVRLRNEAHRFAQRYHHILIKKALLS